jgi:hypothetical protein
METLKVRCEKVEAHSQRYGLKTVLLSRADGLAGWLHLTGTDLVNAFEEGREYILIVHDREDA